MVCCSKVGIYTASILAVQCFQTARRPRSICRVTALVTEPESVCLSLVATVVEHVLAS